MSYTDVFGNNTLPPSGYAYNALTLTADTTFVWPYNATDTDNAIAKILDITCSAGVSMVFPAANLVSTGEDFLIRNAGSETLTLKDSTSGVITTLASGTAKYFFVTDNTTAAGVWGNVTYGAGSSSATAGDLIGYGIKAVTNSLNQAHTVYTDAANITIDATYRAKLVVSTGGTCTIALTAVATMGNDFFFLYRNEGTGSATINPAGVETFDGATTFLVQPGESLIAVCSGTTWYSVGYGRATLYQFTQLVKDVSVAGSFTLTASEASNKLLSFTGNPASAVTIIVPSVVAVYYVQSAISTAQSITIKTAAGTGAAVAQSTKAILICDATNVSSAQTATATGGIALDAGSAAAPSLNFSASTNTGLFLKGVNGVGLSANGVEIGSFETTGLELVSPLAITEGGTGRATSTTAYGLLAAGTTATGVQQTLAVGLATEILVGGGAAALPVWTAATGTGAPVRATSPTLVTPILGTPTSGTLTNCTGLPAAGVVGTALVAAAIGTTVQGYDADTAKVDVTQTFSVPQRGTITTDNDGSFDLNATNNFKCTTAGALALTFTNIPSGQSGNILFINGGNHAITAHANTKVTSSLLAIISVTGTYLLGYFSDGTNVYVAGTSALS